MPYSAVYLSGWCGIEPKAQNGQIYQNKEKLLNNHVIHIQRNIDYNSELEGKLITVSLPVESNTVKAQINDAVVKFS